MRSRRPPRASGRPTPPTVARSASAAGPSAPALRLLLAGIAVLVLASPAPAKVFISRSEALALAFPGAEVESRTFVLSDEQAERVQALARAPLDSRLVTLYTATGEHGVIGYAVIDVHRVRTMPEALLVVLDPRGAVHDLRLLAFHEPEEYAPSPRWLELFRGRRLSEGIRVGGDVDAIAGSTLSSRAVTRAVRRAAALYRVLVGSGAADEGR